MKNNSLAEKCRGADISYSSALKYRRIHSEMTDDDIVEHFKELKKNKREISFIEMCKRAGVNYSKAIRYRIETGLDDEVVIELIINEEKNKVKSFKSKCDEAGVSYSAARNIKNTYKDWTDEQILDEAIRRKDIRDSKADIIVFGVKYDTIKELTNKFKIKYEAFISYMKHHNVSYEEAVNYYLNPSYNYEVFGKKYKYISEIVNEYELDITTGTFIDYMKKYSISIEDTVNHYLYEVKQKPDNLAINNKGANSNTQYVIIEEQSYSCKQAIKIFNLSNNTVRKLVKNGMTRAEAVMYLYNNGITNNKRQKLKFNCVEYKTKTSCLKALGINTSRYYEVKRRFTNYSDEQIIQYLVDHMSDYDLSVSINGIKYESVKQACDDLGLAYHGVCVYAYRNNCTSEESIKYHLENSLYVKDTSITINNIRYKTIKEMCIAFEIDYTQYNNYRRTHELSHEMCIIHFKPNLYINIFGELVDLEG